MKCTPASSHRCSTKTASSPWNVSSTVTTIKFLLLSLLSLPVSYSWTTTTMTKTTTPIVTTGGHRRRRPTTTTRLGAKEDYQVVFGLPPLGIVFEDIGDGYPPKGVRVVALSPGGKGEECGKIRVGDRLKSCSAIQIKPGSSSFDWKNIDCTKLDFDTVVSAITSNDPKFGCDRVEMTFTRPEEEEEKKKTTDDEAEPRD